MASPHRIPPEPDAPSTTTADVPNAAADAAVEAAEEAARSAAGAGRRLSARKADAAADAWLTAQGSPPAREPKRPKRRVHRKHPTPRCARPKCKNRLPANRVPGSKLYGSDLCTPCAKEFYAAMKRNPKGQAYFREWCAKEYSAASMVAEPEKVRRADGKIVDARRVTEGPRPAGVSQNPQDYSQEKLRAMALARAKALKKADS